MTSKLPQFTKIPSKSSLIPPAQRPQPPQSPPKSKKYRTISALDTEFHYYRTLLKILVPTLSNANHKENIVLPWVHKLTQPQTKQSQCEKRNRHMMMLCLMCMRDDVEGVFHTVKPAPLVPIPEISQKHKPKNLNDPLWDCNQYWDSMLEQKKGDPKTEKGRPKKLAVKCGVHVGECPVNKKMNAIGEMLDKQFKLFLHIAVPYAAMLPRSVDRLRAAKWLKALCEVDQKSCGISKGIRNDYIMAMLGYLKELQLMGPFLEDPPKPLSPIAETALHAAALHPITDPTSTQANEFLQDSPAPENGAFAFLILTSDVYNFAKQ